MRAAAVVCFLAVATYVHGATHTVDCEGGGGFATIQAAVDASSDGDVILVAPCVYEERVVIPLGIVMTIEGSGADATELTWPGPGATLEFSQPSLTVKRIAVTRTPDSYYAIKWGEGSLYVEDCAVSGHVRGGYYHGEVDVRRSTVTKLGVSGGTRGSTVEDSRIGEANFGAPDFSGGHSLLSSGSHYRTLRSGSAAYCVADSIGEIDLWGGPESYQSFRAEDSTISRMTAQYSAKVDLEECSLGEFEYEFFYGDIPYLRMSGCFVSGSASVMSGWKGRAQVPRDSQPPRDLEGFRLEHNTVAGQFDFLGGEDWFIRDRYIRGNVVVGETTVSAATYIVVSHNDFVGGSSITTLSDSVFANVSVDPLFCDSPGDYSLQECSPCVGAAHDGGDMGAFGVGCECLTSVKRLSWTRIKGLFRQQPN